MNAPLLLLFMSIVARLMCAPQSSRESEEVSELDNLDFLLTPDDYLRAQEFLKSGNATNTPRNMQSDVDLIGNDIIEDENYRAFVFPDPGLRKPYKEYLWKNGVVPYKIEGNFNYGQRMQLCLAIEILAEKTCVRWMPWTNEKNYVRIMGGKGCSSTLGRIGGGQMLRLGPECFERVGAIVHEMMHSLGFIHEQSRPDRDQFIEVQWDNIEENAKSQYRVCQLCDTMGIPYNPGSIMHYQDGFFAKDLSKPTMKWVGPGFFMILGNPLFDVTKLDIKNIRRAYECDRMSHDKNAVVECPDLKDDCDMIKARGDCDKEKAYALAYCRKTCGRCGICEDANKDSCSSWVKSGMCNKKIMLEYMTLFCAKTCKTCITSDQKSKCYDVHPNCQKWASGNQCIENYPYMSQYCAKSCGTCKYPEEAPDDPVWDDAVQAILRCIEGVLESIMDD